MFRICRIWNVQCRSLCIMRWWTYDIDQIQYLVTWQNILQMGLIQVFCIIACAFPLKMLCIYLYVIWYAKGGVICSIYVAVRCLEQEYRAYRKFCTCKREYKKENLVKYLTFLCSVIVSLNSWDWSMAGSSRARFI